MRAALRAAACAFRLRLTAPRSPEPPLRAAAARRAVVSVRLRVDAPAVLLTRPLFVSQRDASSGAHTLALADGRRFTAVILAADFALPLSALPPSAPVRCG